MFISALLMGSTAASIGIKNHSFSFGELYKQLFLSGFAFVIMIFVARIPYQIYFKISKHILIGSLFLLALTLISGKSVNGTTRWLTIPGFGITIQTTDIVRLALVMHIAKIISEFNANKDDLKEMFKRILYWTIPILIIVALINVSTAILIAVTVLFIVFFTPIDIKFYAKIFILVAVGGILMIIAQDKFDFGRGSTSVSRIIGADDYQKKQSLIAVSNAPILPNPGSSKQKYLISNSSSDFIFSIAIEEYGFIGIFVIISMYIFLMYRIIVIVRQQKRSFPMFLILGIAMNVLLQAFMHMFVNVGIGPVTGQPLPFVSMGGTSTVITATQIGIILHISSLNATKPTPVVEKDINKEIDNYDDNENENVAEVEKDEEIKINDYPFLVG